MLGFGVVTRGGCNKGRRRQGHTLAHVIGRPEREAKITFV
jgi:hypothetical protein